MKWKTIKRYSQRAGKEVLAVSEASFLTLKDPELSWKYKAALVASLAYLVLPLDAFPDFLPGGYADDLSIMLAAVASAGKVGKKHLKECRLKHGITTETKDIN